MTKRKKAQEELMRTHVLNLNEIREAEINDKRERRKKIPATFLLIGIILIVLGICISTLLTIKEKTQIKKKPVVKTKEKLVCVSNLKDNYYFMDIYTKTEYIFKKDKLYSSKTTSTSTPFGETNNIPVLQNDIHINAYETDTYNDLYIKYKLNLISQTKLQLDYEINYDNFLITTKQSVINNYTRVPVFNNAYDYDNVKKESEKMGALCN